MFLTHKRASPAAMKGRVMQKPGNSSVLHRKMKTPFEPRKENLNFEENLFK